MDPARRRRPPLRRTIGAALLLLALTSCNFGMYPGATTQGSDINRLYRILFSTAIVVGVVVYGLLFWSLIRYRKRRNDDGSLPKQFRYNLPIEIVYTAIPVIIVLVLFAFTFTTEQRVDALTPNPAVTVNVTGFRWQWRFDFPAYRFSIVGVNGSPSAGPTIELPVGQPVRITLRSPDVIHSFFVAAFNFKRDVIPGMTNVFDMTITHAGVYRGSCAELCGIGHDDMTFYIRGVSPSEFQAWAQGHQGQGVITGSGP